jgi:hypothetical protein
MTTVDLDLAGLLRLRLVDPADRDREAIVRQLGCPAIPADGDADLTIRYIERMGARNAESRRIGPGDVRWTDDGLVLVRGHGRSERWALVPFDRIGTSDARVEIACERDIGPVPLLMSAINLTLLGRGVLPLHASSFVAGGSGIVAAGWSKSGKTEALLAFMDRGARIVADEWTYVHADRSLSGLPTPIRLEPWHLAQRPALVERLDPRERRRLGRLSAVRRGRGLASRAAQKLPGRRLIDGAFDLALANDRVDVALDDLFSPDRRAPTATADVVFWMVPHESSAIETSAVAPSDFAARMATAHVHHRREFLDAYWRFRYAFPDRRNPLVDAMEERELELLETTIGEREVIRVEHPKPVDLGRLADAMSRHLPPRTAS